MSTMRERWAEDTREDWLGAASFEGPPPGTKIAAMQGDLWDMHASRKWKIVITTNIGWDLETKRNNMGAGMALQAAERWPSLPEWYGRFCERTAPDTPVVERQDRRLIFLPVKPLLDERNPELSWNQTAKLWLIERSVKQLAQFEGRIALAYPGAGNGGLMVEQVRPILEHYLPGDRFVIVDRRAS